MAFVGIDLHSTSLQMHKISDEGKEISKKIDIGVLDDFSLLKLHWQLDVSFSEDQCRKRMGSSAQNFLILRKMTLNMLKQDKSKKVGIASKRRCACYDEDYFHHIMTTYPNNRESHFSKKNIPIFNPN